VSGFLSPRALLDGGPTGLTHAIERALWHLGYEDVRVIDGRNDAGADILAVRNAEQWIIQAKWSGRQPIDRTGVDDCERAKAAYGADVCVLATNATLNRRARDRRALLSQVGIRVDIWDGPTLAALFDRMPSSVPSRPQLRSYQIEAISAVEHDLESKGSGLLVLATGLGKTVVGGELIRRYLDRCPTARVLVVAHLRELVEQLERAIWKHLSKETPSQVLTGLRRPGTFEGVTFSTADSALGLVQGGYRPALIMIDETHHVAEAGRYQRILDLCASSRKFGVTATPWRGDRFDIAMRFGAPSFSMGIDEGMAAGYLAKVDYKLFVDNLDWDFVQSISANSYTLKDLNSLLFLPQRDETIVDEVRAAWQSLRSPRALVFCQSIEHAERMATLFASADPVWRRAAAIHSGLSQQKRQVLLNAFRLGRAPLLTSVDVFNEGVDVPDVNLIAFLRVTHSRRIFVQQLGRGLRVREGKEALLVLDFVSDLRRVAAALRLRRSMAGGERETLALPLGRQSNIDFTDARAGSLLNEWIKDAADLETAADEVRLNFPDVGYGVT
jgi:superfamily II DNA or RNA helicase